MENGVYKLVYNTTSKLWETESKNKSTTRHQNYGKKSAKARAQHDIKTMENRVQTLEHNTIPKLWKTECKK